jgi:hypothetical protein
MMRIDNNFARKRTRGKLLQFLWSYKLYWISSLILVLFIFALIIILGVAAGSAKPFMYTFTH